jgi:hypothetical protein
LFTSLYGIKGKGYQHLQKQFYIYTNNPPIPGKVLPEIFETTSILKISRFFGAGKFFEKPSG